MEPLAHADSKVGILVEPLAHADSKVGILVEPLVHADSNLGILGGGFWGTLLTALNVGLG